jgi:hypothetical protein
MVGYRGATDPADLFLLTLDQALAPAESLVLQGRNFENSNKLTLTLENGFGDILAQSERIFATLRVGGLPAGTYTVRVEGGSGGEALYHLAASIGGPVELEPNDSVLLAHDLGTLTASSPLEIHARSNPIDIDLFTFDLAAALGSGESIEARLFNLDSGKSLILDFHTDGTDASNSVVSTDNSDSAIVIAAPAFATGPFALKVINPGTSSEDYRLQVRVAGPAEVEPNDLQANATLIEALPIQLRGTIRDGDTDVFEFVHTDNLGLLQALVFKLENESDGTSITLQVLEGDFTTDRGGGTGFRITRPLYGANPDTYYAVVTGGDTLTGSSDVYTLDVYLD